MSDYFYSFETCFIYGLETDIFPWGVPIDFYEQLKEIAVEENQ